MVVNKPFPKFVYKILDAAPPSPITPTLPLSSLDSKDGFIHLSDAGQIPITADLFFGSNTRLWLLKISSAKAQEGAGRLVWPEGLHGCVHLYEGKLGGDVVAGVKEYEKGGSANWADAMRESDGQKWLVDQD